MNYITDTLDKDLRKLGYDVTKEVKIRDNGVSFTVIYLFNLNGEITKVKIDANIRDFYENKARVLDMLADKFSAISSDIVLRRNKDIYDIYIILNYLEHLLNKTYYLDLIKILKEPYYKGRFGDCSQWMSDDGRERILHVMSSIPRVQ